MTFPVIHGRRYYDPTVTERVTDYAASIKRSAHYRVAVKIAHSIKHREDKGAAVTALCEELKGMLE